MRYSNIKKEDTNIACLKNDERVATMPGNMRNIPTKCSKHSKNDGSVQMMQLLSWLANRPIPIETGG
jgi:hypothetical protein